MVIKWIVIKIFFIFLLGFCMGGCGADIPRIAGSVSFSELKAEPFEEFLNKGDKCFQLGQYTEPEGNNAYEFFQNILLIDHSNQNALNRIRDILEKLLNVYEQKLNEYSAFLDAENKGVDVRQNMIHILSDMIRILKDAKRICEEHPTIDPERDGMINIFKENISKYEKLIQYYQH